MKHNEITEALRTYRTGRKIPEQPRLSCITIDRSDLPMRAGVFSNEEYITEMRLQMRFSVSGRLNEPQAEAAREHHRDMFADELHHTFYKDFHTELMELREYVYGNDRMEAEKKILELLSFCRGQ